MIKPLMPLIFRRFERKVIDSEEVAPRIEILGVKQRTPEQFKNIDFPLKKGKIQEIRQWFER